MRDAEIDRLKQTQTETLKTMREQFQKDADEIERLKQELAETATHRDKLREAAQNYLNANSGGKKLCGHDFCCVCPGDMLREALSGGGL